MSAQGKYISRVCVIHPTSQNCLYDRIWPGDEDLWMSSDEKYDQDMDFPMDIQFPVSGTRRERMMRQELLQLLTSFFQISRSIDDGSVFKAAFQLPAENRQSNFTVKFTPQFGTLARPKKNINTKISSMVFGQAQTEMVMASKSAEYKTRKEKKRMKKAAKGNYKVEEEEKKEDKKKKNHGEFVCVVFYGVNVKPDTASNLSKSLINKFFDNFSEEIQRLLMRLDRERAAREDSDDDSDDDDDDELEQMAHLGGGNDGGDSENNKNQEYMMQQFKKFDEIVIRDCTRYIDRRDRKISSNQRGLYSSSARNKRKHKTSHNQQNGKGNNNDVIEEAKSEEEDGDY